MARDLAFWLAVALVSIAASVLTKIASAHVPWAGFHTFAAAS